MGPSILLSGPAARNLLVHAAGRADEKHLKDIAPIEFLPVLDVQGERDREERMLPLARRAI
jgi:hypothetical protein